MKKIRLHKFMADQGIDSRRKCENFILEGLVKVNGKVVTKLGSLIDPFTDKVSYNNKKISLQQNNYVTLALYKPRGYVCTTAGNEGRNVYQLLSKVKTKVASIGRLDKNSEGLLLFSNDGSLIYELTHPSFEHKKIYNVMVSGVLSPQLLKALNSKMLIDGYLIKPAKVKILRPGEKLNRYLLEFTLTEGRKRQIRKMCEQHNLNVHRLIRVQVNQFKLKGLQPGKWRILSSREIKQLQSK